MDNCPRCGNILSRGAYECECGWRARTSREVARTPVNALGYTQCDWEAERKRCRYPGTISPSTHGNGPNFCRLHFGLDDPRMGAIVVNASQEYEHFTPQQQTAQDIARMNAEAHAWCLANGLERRDDETIAQWRQRHRQWAREKAKAIGHPDRRAA